MSLASGSDVNALLTLPDGSVIAGGNFFHPGSPGAVQIARYRFSGLAPATIIAQPTSTVSCASGTAAFSIAATGDAPLTYRWRWRPDNVPFFVDVVSGINTHPTTFRPSFSATGIGTTTVSISPIGSVDRRMFNCMVSNACNTVTSNTVQLSVCVADTDDGTGTGTCDGGVTIDDLLYYLLSFENGSIAADVDDGTATGTPDGGVTIDDLLYYLQRFEAGC